jgi:maleate isomerase
MRALPAGVTVHAARMFLAETTAEAERRMICNHVPIAVADLATLRSHVVAFFCTSGGAVLGGDGKVKFIGDIAETGARVVSTNDAVGTAIARQGRQQRIAVLTPYINELTQAIGAGLERRGLTVVHIAGLGITDNFAICSVTPSEILPFAERELAGRVFDLLFVPCTNFRAVEARPLLQRRFGVPVVTSNQATIDATFAAIGARDQWADFCRCANRHYGALKPIAPRSSFAGSPKARELVFMGSEPMSAPVQVCVAPIATSRSKAHREHRARKTSPVLSVACTQCSEFALRWSAPRESWSPAAQCFATADANA